MNTFKRHKKLIPALILLGITVRTVVQLLQVKTLADGSVITYTLTGKHIGAFIALIVTLLSYILFRRGYNYFLGVTIILGVLGTINFFRDETTSWLSLNSVTVNFQPAMLIVAVVMLLVNFDKVPGWITKNGTQ